MGKHKFLWVWVLFGLIGAVYTFGSYSFVKAIGFGLRHNDHVMIGILGLCVAVVALYRWFVDFSSG